MKREVDVLVHLADERWSESGSGVTRVEEFTECYLCRK